MIATNTTISRTGLKTQRLAKTGTSPQEEAGGISGAPLKARSTEVIRQIWQYTEGKLPIIGTGGVASADDAWEKITAGASLLEVYTGWIYEARTGKADTLRTGEQIRRPRLISPLPSRSLPSHLIDRKDIQEKAPSVQLSRYNGYLRAGGGAVCL